MINSVVKVIFVLMLAIHGLIHLFGFLKAFDLAKIDKLTRPISRPLGLLWLLAALLLVVTSRHFCLQGPRGGVSLPSWACCSRRLIFTARRDATWFHPQPDPPGCCDPGFGQSVLREWLSAGCVQRSRTGARPASGILTESSPANPAAASPALPALCRRSWQTKVVSVFAEISGEMSQRGDAFSH